MPNYAIGDIQGCFEPLKRLLDAIKFAPAKDRLWFVGDLVNRGPESLATLRFIKALGERAVTVLGNHDLHLLAVAEGFARQKPGDTIADVLAAPDRDELLQWLRHHPLMHVEGEYALIHAGLLPEWTVARARELAWEVETALRGKGYRDFLKNMYGNAPDRWDEALTGYRRLRVIVNALTRLRVCSHDGIMDLRYNGELKDVPKGLYAWFNAPGRSSSDAVVVCGHWSALGLLVRPDVLALDSGCTWGGSLSAVRLDDREVFQIACERENSIHKH
jgi:bis(5'-nucleosyl)-tetraphosphatase (symmetrical)